MQYMGWVCMPCYRARHEISLQSWQDFKKLDPFYSMKHDCEKSILVNRLAQSLAQKGIQADIELESKHLAGVLDIQITLGTKSTRNASDKTKTIAVEWKSGNTFSLFQLIRYLFECNVLVLVRSQRNQVICFKRNEIVEFLIQLSSFLQDRVKRLRIDHSPQKILGPQCVGCPAGYCGYCKPPLNHSTAVTEEYIKNSTVSSLECIDSCIEKVIAIIE